MKRYSGESKVRGGYYFNLAHWNIAAVEGHEGLLEGPASENYVKLPLPVMLVVAACMSFGYVLFLPFIGFAMVANLLFGKAASAGKKAMSNVFATVTPTWRPGEAHFVGKPGEEKKMGEKKEERERNALTELRKEVEDKRAEEEEARK
jgi:hypothetical protein